MMELLISNCEIVDDRECGICENAFLTSYAGGFLR